MHLIIRRIEQVAMFVAGTCVVLIMLIVSVDAVGRYVFNSPLRWGYDLVTYYLMIAAVYFALSSTYQRGDHIAVDVVKHLFSLRFRWWLDISSSVVATIVFAVIAYASLNAMLDAYGRRDMIPGVVLWPAWLSYAPIPVGSALLVWRLLHHSVMLARFGRDPHVTSDSEAAQ
jgi:TRAP-type C4-dicarboxylate transport system permease small subunit